MSRLLQRALRVGAVGFGFLLLTSCDGGDETEKRDRDQADAEVTVESVCKKADRWPDETVEFDQCMDDLNRAMGGIHDKCGTREVGEILLILDQCADRSDSEDELEECSGEQMEA